MTRGCRAGALGAGLSSFHFQRLLTFYVGISPMKFLQHLTLKKAKESLVRSASVLDAAYDPGLSDVYQINLSN